MLKYDKSAELYKLLCVIFRFGIVGGVLVQIIHTAFYLQKFVGGLCM